MPNGNRNNCGSERSGAKRRFALAATFHQFLDRIAWILAVVENRMHLLGDRHFDSTSPSQADCCCSCKDSFGDHPMHASNDFRQLSSATEFDAHAAIARKP